MDFRKVFPFQKRSLESGRAIQKERKAETLLRPCSESRFVWRGVEGWGGERGKGEKRGGEMEGLSGRKATRSESV